MTRYVIMADNKWVTALYGPGIGIGLTPIKEDASSWVTYERAIAAARSVAEYTSSNVVIQSVDEPTYPQSWK